MKKGDLVICIKQGSWRSKFSYCEKHPQFNKEVLVIGTTTCGLLILKGFNRCVRGTLKGYNSRYFQKPILTSRITRRLAHTVLADRYANKLAFKDSVLESDVNI